VLGELGPLAEESPTDGRPSGRPGTATREPSL
jgi:hypothetical protein